MERALPALRGNVAWTFFGNAVYAFCQWLVVVIIAKLGSPSLVGQFTLGVAICAPVMLLSGLSLRVVQANDVNRSRPFGLYLGLRILTTAIAFVVIAGIALTGGYSRTATAIIVLLGVAKAAEALSEVFWGQLQQQEHMSAIARSMILRGALSVAAILAALAAGYDLVSATAALALAWLLTLFVYDVPSGYRYFRDSLRPMFDRSALYRLAALSLPLAVGLLMVSLSVNIPRYFLAHYRGEHELGVFTAIANLMLVGTTFVAAVTQAVSPRLARSYLAGDRAAFVRVFNVVLLIALALGAIGILIAAVVGGPVLALIYTHDYAAASNVLTLVMIAALGNYFGCCFGTAVVAMGEFRAPVPLHLLNVAVVTIGSLIMIPRSGATGAAWVLIASNCSSALTFGALTVHCLRRKQAHGVRP